MNPQVNLISSTYDPTKQTNSLYANKLKTNFQTHNTPNQMQNKPQLTSLGNPLPKLPPPPQSYPQPSTFKYTQPNPNEQIYEKPFDKYDKQNDNQYYDNKQKYSKPINTSSKNIDNTGSGSKNIFEHPSQSGMPQKDFTNNLSNIHTNNSNKNNTNNTNNTSNTSFLTDKISDKIYNHFKLKYPTTIDASGFSKNTIITIVTQSMKKEPLNEKTISKIIDIIDYKFKSTINSDNRQGIQYDTTSFSMDDKSKISVDTFLESYTNKVSILSDSDKALEADLPKKMSPINDTIKIDPPEPFSEDFPIRDRAKQTDMMIPEVREYNYYVVINSNDRNTTKFPDPNNFVIDFAPAPSGENNQLGYIDRSFHNIKTCELLDIVVLDTSTQPDSSDSNGKSYPYLLLQFDELQNNYYGTNSNLTKSFAILTSYSATGKYKYYRVFGDSSEDTVYKVYNPRINLNKLTTRLLLPNGDPFFFGSAFTNDTSNSCITIGFRLITIQMNLATQYVNSA